MHVRLALTLFMLCAGLAAREANAGPALLIDAEDGKVLYSEDADSQWHPASLTKIMTAYLTFTAIKSGKIALDTPVPCSLSATQVQPSKLGLAVGQEITVETALQALIVKSANDVAIMLAELVGGSQENFVAEMNATARRLGMTRTTFVNPNGLPTPEQVTTARDLARLGRAAFHDFPEYSHYWAMQEAQVGKIKLTSHNGLLKTFEGADGMKTGFICDSGFNVVASATRDGTRLMAVVLGEQTGGDRTLRAASLLEHGFQQLGWKQLFNTTTIDNMPIAADAKSITSMRQSVVSWECGTGRRTNAVAAARKAKLKAARAAKAKKDKEAALAATAPGVAPAGPAAAAPVKPAGKASERPPTVAPAAAAKPQPSPSAAAVPPKPKPAPASPTPAQAAPAAPSPPVAAQ